MNRIELAAIATDLAGQLATVTYTDGTDLTVVINGNVNSKGLVVRHHADEPVFYIAPTKIESVNAIDDEGDDFQDMIDDDDELADDDDTSADQDIEDDELSNEDIYAMLEDGMSTADLAAVLSDHLNITLEPKELRVHLRALGLGVGKGRKYSLSATEFRMVKDLIATSN